MEESNPDFDQVKRYLKGEMGQHEREQFEERINKDPELAQQVDLDQVLLEGIQLHYRGELKEKLRRLDYSDSEIAAPVFPLYRVLAIVAGIVLILVVGLLVFKDKPDTEALYTAYFKPYYNIVTDIERGGIAGQDPEENPYQLYEMGQYEKANEMFEKLLLANPDDRQLIFYNGLSYLNSGNTARAIENLLKVAGRNEFPSSATAGWYLGLAYLKENRIEEAQEIFKWLLEKDDGYASRSREILEELE